MNVPEKTWSQSHYDTAKEITPDEAEFEPTIEYDDLDTDGQLHIQEIDGGGQ